MINKIVVIMRKHSSFIGRNPTATFGLNLQNLLLILDFKQNKFLSPRFLNGLSSIVGRLPS